MLCSCGKFSTEIIPQKCHSSFRFEVFLNVMFATEMLFLCMLILMFTFFSRVVFISIYTHYKPKVPMEPKKLKVWYEFKLHPT